MKNKNLLTLTLLLIASMVLASCGGSAPAGDSGAEAAEVPQQQPQQQPQATPATSASGSESSGGSAQGTPITLDPANAGGDKAAAALGYVYEGLVDAEGNGVLASDILVSEDGLEYTFNLRPGVKFHDGAELNADLVIENFNRWFDPADANRGSGTYEAWMKNFNGFKGEKTDDGKPKSQYDGIEKVNDFTVLVHLNTPDPDFISKIANVAFAISSPTGFAGGDGGSGPYVSAGNDGAALKLEPFDGYWDPASVPTSGMEAPLQ